MARPLEVGDALGGVEYTAVSIALRRFENRLQQDRHLQKTERQVPAMLNVETPQPHGGSRQQVGLIEIAESLAAGGPGYKL